MSDMNSGIYKIKINKHFYFGQSKNLDNRKAQHIYFLESGKHNNAHLQNAFNKYGDFEFEVICYAPVNKLNWLEQGFLDRYVDEKYCCNIASCAEVAARGLKRSEETIQKMSESKKKLWEDPEFRKRNPGRRGKTCSKIHKKRMSASIRERYQDPEVKEKHRKALEKRRSKRVFIFEHEDGRVEKSTVYDFHLKHNLSIGSIKNLKQRVQKTHKGWVCIGEVVGKIECIEGLARIVLASS